MATSSLVAYNVPATLTTAPGGVTTAYGAFVLDGPIPYYAILSNAVVTVSGRVTGFGVLRVGVYNVVIYNGTTPLFSAALSLNTNQSARIKSLPIQGIIARKGYTGLTWTAYRGNAKDQVSLTGLAIVITITYTLGSILEPNTHTPLGAP